MGRPTRWLGFPIAASVVIACNALTGAGDLVEADGTDGGTVDAPITQPVDAPVTKPPTDATSDSDAPKVDAGPALPCPAAGRSCAPAPPAGWEGPFLVYKGLRTDAPACPSEMPTVRDDNVGSPSGSIDCSQCRCASPKGAACSVSFFEFASADCPAGTSVRSSGAGVCTTPTVAEPYLSILASATVSPAGTCDPFVSPTGKVKGAVTWPEVLRLCRRDTDFLADGCNTGELCVPDGKAPFKTHTCIRTDVDDAVCPAGWTEKLETFSSFDDTRDCSPTGCSCGTPNGVDCNGNIRNYGAATNCSGTFTSVPIGTCINVTTESHRLVGGVPATGGFCSPSGSPTPTGGVTPKLSARDVVCCLP